VVFRPFAADYTGVDYHSHADADVVAPAEELPFEDQSFDCLICTQLLEHAEDPHAVLREAHRVLRPGGTAFVSTHGVAVYHPTPSDYWRWTHAGLARMFHTTGEWRSVDVYPNGGTASALAYITGLQVHALADKIGLDGIGALLGFPINVLSWNADRFYRRLFPTRPPDLAPNYLAVGERADD
jgi:SAM-dependent methyltransferase